MNRLIYTLPIFIEHIRCNKARQAYGIYEFRFSKNFRFCKINRF